MPANIEFPLDLPEVRILKADLSKREIVITVESTRAWAICPRCGERTDDFHSFSRQLCLRHLPILGRRKSSIGMTNAARTPRLTISGCC